MTATAAQLRDATSDSLRDRMIRMRRTALGFLRMGYLRSIAYPLGFVLEQLHALVFPVIFVFIADLTGAGGNAERFGGDYYTFVIIGIFSIHAITAGIRGFSAELDQAILHGNFEMLLVEPVRWRMLPFGMSLWPTILGFFTGGFILLSRCATRSGIPGRRLAAGAPHRRPRGHRRVVAVHLLRVGEGLGEEG